MRTLYAGGGGERETGFKNAVRFLTSRIKINKESIELDVTAGLKYKSSHSDDGNDACCFRNAIDNYIIHVRMICISRRDQ